MPQDDTPYTPVRFSPREERRLEAYKQAVKSGFYSDDIKGHRKSKPIPESLKPLPEPDPVIANPVVTDMSY